MPAFLYDLMNLELPKGNGRLYFPVLETEDKRAAMEEKRAEMSGWYSQLLADAEVVGLTDLSANEILQHLAGATTDKKLPKSAAGLPILTQLEKQLAKDGYTLTSEAGRQEETRTIYDRDGSMTLEQLDHMDF